MTASPAAPPPRTYYPELDGVRAIAAAMVILFHLAMHLGRVPRVIGFGQTGVDLFFVLSGFLITSILLKCRERSWDEVRRFYVRRTLRIFPLYYGYLTLAALLGVPTAVWYWVYLQNIWISVGGSLTGPGHFWSLAVEEQFYLAWPLVVLFLPRRWLARGLWAVFFGSMLCRLLLSGTEVNLFYFTATRLDGLAAGALLAVYQGQGRLLSARRLLKLLAVVSLLLVAWQGMRYRGASLVWVQITKYTLISVVYASGIGLILTGIPVWLRRTLGSAPMRSVGRVSYGLYVFHQAVFAFCFRHFAHCSPIVRSVLGLAGTFAVAQLSWYLYERRFVRLKDRLAPETSFSNPGVAAASA